MKVLTPRHISEDHTEAFLSSARSIDSLQSLSKRGRRLTTLKVAYVLIMAVVIVVVAWKFLPRQRSFDATWLSESLSPGKARTGRSSCASYLTDRFGERDEIWLLEETGFHTRFKVFAAGGEKPPNATLKQIFAIAADAAATSQSLAVLVYGDVPPARRQPEQQFLSITSPSNKGVAEAMADVLGISTLNTVVRLLEDIKGTLLYPLRLEIVQFPPTVNLSVAIYDVSDGVVYFDMDLASKIVSWKGLLGDALSRFSSSMFQQLQVYYKGPEANTLMHQGVVQLGEVMAAAAAAAVAVALVYKTPLWFCLACPTVLGILSPFVFNLGLTEVANEICNYYKLQEEDCNDLWYGAFALAMVLSLASAIPIVYICRLPECIKHGAI